MNFALPMPPVRRALDWLRARSRPADSFVAAFPPLREGVDEDGTIFLFADRPDGGRLTATFDPHARRIDLILWTRRGTAASHIASHVPLRVATPFERTAP